MRFIENGPDIPDELLYAQDEGNVVFFCGAGVSMAYANLSSFADLAEKVIEDLGATEQSKAKRLFTTFTSVNKDPHTRGHISADHIFSSLARSFHLRDINCSVASNLLPAIKPDLSAHKIILKLARLRGGQTRLITTNFDLLFEACDQNLKSLTRSSLPRIEFADNDWGIVHLHGKVRADYSGPDHDGFVLSSSEFGDAYLAHGWARNFVKDVLRKFVAVFIGYSADDPPVRYLLEGLQQGNSTNHQIYAFQSGPDDEAVSQWDEKGVETIVYELDEAQTHSPLWDTLKLWGIRSKDPIEWKKKVFARGRKGPSKLQSHERGMVAHLIKSQSGARAFEQADPPMPAEWLCVFDHKIRLRQPERESYPYSEGELINPYQLYALDNDPPPSDRNEEFNNLIQSEIWNAFSLNAKDYEELSDIHLPSVRGFRSNKPSNLPPRLAYLSNWISKVSEQRIAVWWAGQQQCLHPEILGNVKTRIRLAAGKPLSKSIAKAWSIIFELNYFYSCDEHQEFSLKSHIKTFGWSNLTVSEFARVSAPYLKRGTIYNNFIPRDNRKRITDFMLVRAEIGYPKDIYDIEIPEKYIAQIVNIMRINLEKAVDMNQEFSGWFNLCSIEPDEDTQGQEFVRGYNLSGYVLYFVSLFRKLHDHDKAKARSEHKKWYNTDPVFALLRIWASSLKDIVTKEDFSNEILSLNQEDFWSFKGRRDLLLTLKSRWNELSPNDRNLIEKKILKGPSKLKSVSKAEHVIRSANIQLNIFHWLNNQGCKLTFNLEELTKELRQSAQRWKPEFAAKAAESNDQRGGRVESVTDWGSLKSLPLSEIIGAAKKQKKNDLNYLIEYAPFSGLCDDAPIKALGALTYELKRGEFSSNYWEIYLSRGSRKQDKYRLKLLTGGRITQMRNEQFQSILITASRWFEDAGPEIREKNIKMYEGVWNKFIDTISQNEAFSGSILVRQEEIEVDWTGEAINSPSGNLAQLHMTDPEKENLKAGMGFPKIWLKRLEQLLALPGDAHRYAMVIFAFNFSWFHYIDPKWTENNFLKIIEDQTTEKEDKDAIWAGFMWGARTPNADLYIKLKPHLLKMANEEATERRRHVEVLSGILLSGWGSKDKKRKRYVTDLELREVLLNAGDDFRSHTLWHLERWSSEENNNWGKKVLEFLQNVWPKHKKVRTSKTSARLCEIALNQKENFPVISQQVSLLVSKTDNEHLYLPEISNSAKDEEENCEDLVSLYPEEYLNLIYAILHDQPERWPYGTIDILRKIENIEPKLINDPRLIELKSRINDH